MRDETRPRWRIDVRRHAEGATLYVCGRLVGDGSAELARLASELDASVVVDLAELLWTDEVGAAILRRLRGDGFDLRHATPFVRLLIEGRLADGPTELHRIGSS